MQFDIVGQCFANFGLLIIPGVLICNDRNPLTALEMTGFALWVISFVIESVADTQKAAFIKAKTEAKVKGAVCNVGLWRYSRHPNYFGEWMVWNSLCLMSVQSVLNLGVPIW